jgi:hypothetical protein
MWFDTLRESTPRRFLVQRVRSLLDPLRYLTQRWFSPQALTFRGKSGSWITPRICFVLILCRLVPMKILPIPGKELKLWNRTPYLQLSSRSVSPWEKVQIPARQLGFYTG